MIKLTPCRSGQHQYDHSEYRTCPTCEWISRDKWRYRNRKSIREYSKLWRENNPEKVRSHSKRWREKWGPMAWTEDVIIHSQR